MPRFELTVPVDATDHVIGPSHAAVTLVEYGDFECPDCKIAAPAVRLLLERHAGHIRFAWRNFPLEGVHPHALNAALAAETAGGQGKFWEMHDLLFANQQHLKLPQLRRLAQQLELDMARYDAEMDDQIYLQRIREQIAGGERSGVRATPTFFIDGAMHDVSYGIEHLQEGIEAALRRSGSKR